MNTEFEPIVAIVSGNDKTRTWAESAVTAAGLRAVTFSLLLTTRRVTQRAGSRAPFWMPSCRVPAASIFNSSRNRLAKPVVNDSIGATSERTNIFLIPIHFIQPARLAARLRCTSNALRSTQLCCSRPSSRT